MSFHTTLENQSRQSLDQFEEIWLFGYGSLIYKVDFPILEQQPASIIGWQRRFWQGSHDHRGTPEAPGRVLTLIEAPDSKCAGMAYRVSKEVFEHLDHREKNGYLRYDIDIHFDFKKFNNSSKPTTKRGLVYIAPEDNKAFLGSASEEEIAKHIFNSEGPSGKNKDYVFQLADALRTLDESDEHVLLIEHFLHELE